MEYRIQEKYELNSKHSWSSIKETLGATHESKSRCEKSFLKSLREKKKEKGRRRWWRNAG